MKLPKSIERLTLELSKLPGVGQKTASRLVFYLLKQDSVDIQRLSEAVAELQKNVVYCSICGIMSETDPCSICSDPSREHSIICVVEETLDVQAIDATGAFKGVYHVLGGVLSPLEGIGPDKLTIAQLMARLKNGNPSAGKIQAAMVKDSAEESTEEFVAVKEVILALNPSLEGETTSMDISGRIKPLGIRTTRLARGLPIGGDLEYADEITISNALKGRSET
jgi:recombination protein RecR